MKRLWCGGGESINRNIQIGLLSFLITYLLTVTSHANNNCKILFHSPSYLVFIHTLGMSAKHNLGNIFMQHLQTFLAG